MSAPKRQKVMTTPINQIFRLLQNRTKTLIWLAETPNQKMEGIIIVCQTTLHSHCAIKA